MSQNEIQTIDIKIFGREFKINCPNNEIAALEEATRYVDKEMRIMHQKEKVASSEVIAMITALNLAHELIVHKKKKELMEAIVSRISALKNDIAKVIDKTK